MHLARGFHCALHYTCQSMRTDYTLMESHIVKVGNDFVFFTAYGCELLYKYKLCEA